MTKEELIKNQFPNDEFLQSGVSQIVDKCIAELEKENAELKKQLEMSNKVYNDNLDYSHHIEEQFTKVKVALRNVINYLGQFCSDYPDCVIEAEKILKEE